MKEKETESKRSTAPRLVTIMGSPRSNGKTAEMLALFENIMTENGIGIKRFNLGKKSIYGCIACGYCKEKGHCFVDDDVNAIGSELELASGIVVASPVYYASPNGAVISLLDRLFHSTSSSKKGKIGISMVSARRAGATSAIAVLNNYFLYSGMLLVGSSYWNLCYNDPAREADLEGTRTVAQLAQNTVDLLQKLSFR